MLKPVMDMQESYEEFIRRRITELRIKKNVSEARMSKDMGHSNSYIRSITSGRRCRLWGNSYTCASILR